MDSVGAKPTLKRNGFYVFGVFLCLSLECIAQSGILDLPLEQGRSTPRWYTSSTGYIAVSGKADSVFLDSFSTCGEVEESRIFTSNWGSVTLLAGVVTPENHLVFLLLGRSESGEKAFFTGSVSLEDFECRVEKLVIPNGVPSYGYNAHIVSGEIVFTTKAAPVGGGNSPTTLLFLDYEGRFLRDVKFYDTYTGVDTWTDGESLFLKSAGLFVEWKADEIRWAKQHLGIISGNFFRMEGSASSLYSLVFRNNVWYLVQLDKTGNIKAYSDQYESDNHPLLTRSSESILTVCFQSQNTAYMAQWTEDLAEVSFLRMAEGEETLGVPRFTLHEKNRCLVSAQGVEHASCWINPSRLFCMVEDTLLAQPHTLSINVENLPLEWSSWEIFSISQPCNYTQLQNNSISLRCEESDIEVYDSSLVFPCLSQVEYIPSGYSDTGAETEYYWVDNAQTVGKRTFDTEGIFILEQSVCGRMVRRDTLEVYSTCGCQIDYVTSFSPNQDELNDEFILRSSSCSLSNTRLLVYNRWGEQVFLGSDQWDGRDMSKIPVPEGIYYFEFRYAWGTTSGNHKIDYLRGVVSLLR